VPGTLDLIITARTGRSHVSTLRRYLPRAHALLKPPLRELSVALVGDSRMSALHERFMNITGPTDVLTFPLEFDSRGRPTAGEVVVCMPEAVRRARGLGIETKHEVLLYALHGMLHLSGFDDRTDAAFRTMHRKEDQILIRLGLGPIYDAARLKSGRASRLGEGRAANRRRLGA
jgi:rRNA maturation RNase YbeY